MRIKRIVIVVLLTLLCAFLGFIAAIGISGVGICARNLDAGSIGFAFLCAIGAGICALRLSWGAPIAFAVPFAAMCLAVRAVSNDRNYPVIIVSYVGLVLLITAFAKPAAARP